MPHELDDWKEARRRPRKAVGEGPAGWLRAVGVRAIVLQILAWGGAAGVAAALGLAVAGRAAAPEPPAVPLEVSAGELQRGERRLGEPEARGAGVGDAPGTPTAGKPTAGKPTAGEPTAAVGPTPGVDGDRPDDTPAGGPDDHAEPVEARSERAEAARGPSAGTGDTPDPSPPGGVIVAHPEDALRPPPPEDEGDSPAEDEAAAGAADPDDGCKRYPVLPGDATSSVARRLEVNAADLRKWNPELAEAGPKAGTKLRICKDGRVITGWREKHVEVKRGDTVLRIARAHGLSVENVATANEVHPDRIQLGQDLLVYEAIWE